MSVPVDSIRQGRYYRTSFGSRPAVVKAVTDVLAYTGRVGVVDQSDGALRFVKVGRLFNEVVQAADGSGRWTRIER